MIVSINQPCYLPWGGYFDRIRQSDLHVVLDHVQFEKGSFTNRTRIRQRDGRTHFLTIPVEKHQPINQTRITDRHWPAKHSKGLIQAYGAYELVPVLRNHRRLMAVLEETTIWLLDKLKIDLDKLVTSSSLGGSGLGTKSQLVLRLCQELGADVYLSGPYGHDYLDLDAFAAANIDVQWHDWHDRNDPPLSIVHDLFQGEADGNNSSLSAGARLELPQRH